MTVYYTYSPNSDTADIILAVDGMAWDYQEQLPAIDTYDDTSERKVDLIALLTRLRDVGTLADIFAETFDDVKYPAAEIFTRFPDAIEFHAINYNHAKSPYPRYRLFFIS